MKDLLLDKTDIIKLEFEKTMAKTKISRRQTWENYSFTKNIMQEVLINISPAWWEEQKLVSYHEENFYNKLTEDIDKYKWGIKDILNQEKLQKWGESQIAWMKQELKDTYGNDNNYRDSFNSFIVGKTGSGKSYNVKKQLNWMFLNKTRVFIIDPEREFHGFVNKYNAKVIDCGQAKTGLINPLQIFNNNLQSHIRNLEQWFKLIFPDSNDHIISILEKLLFAVYEQKNINFATSEEQLRNLKINEWPILHDLYLLAVKQFENSKDSIEKEIKGYLKQLSALGAYGQLWNGYTTLDLSLDNFIILDVYTLRNNKKMINAQLFLMLQFLENEAIKNKNRNEFLPEKEQEWVCIAVDEAHLLIDKHNLIALQFLYEMVKRARKYNTSVYIVTQNINDFVGDNDVKKQAEGIMNNCLYQFVHNLADKDLQDYNAILKASGGLNEFELQAISTAKQGDCLFAIGSHNRTFLHIQASATEASAWMKEKNMIDKPVLNYVINYDYLNKQEEIR